MVAVIHNDELPIGFTMELAQNSDALIRFSNLSKPEQDKVAAGARQVHSRDEMRNYVKSLIGQEVNSHENNSFF